MHQIRTRLVPQCARFLSVTWSAGFNRATNSFYIHTRGEKDADESRVETPFSRRIFPRKHMRLCLISLREERMLNRRIRNRLIRSFARKLPRVAQSFARPARIAGLTIH